MNEIKTHLKELCDAKSRYEQQKLDYELNLLKLKYSPEYQIYKTIKEKEERAKLELEQQAWQVLDAKQKVRYFEYLNEIDELNMYYFDVEDSCCGCKNMSEE